MSAIKAPSEPPGHGGGLRFVELRYRSAAQARKRALALFLCTYSAQYHLAVPVLSKTDLHDESVCRSLLWLWDVYHLSWPAESHRGAVHRLQRRPQRMTVAVPFCGSEPPHWADRPAEWFTEASTDGAAVPEMTKRPSVAGMQVRQAREEAFKQKQARLSEMLGEGPPPLSPGRRALGAGPPGDAGLKPRAAGSRAAANRAPREGPPSVPEPDYCYEVLLLLLLITMLTSLLNYTIRVSVGH